MVDLAEGKTVKDGDKLYTHPSNVRRLSDGEICCELVGWLTSYYEGELDPYLIDKPTLVEFVNDVMDACNIPKDGE